MLGRCYLKTYTKAETLRPVSNDELELLSLRSKLPVAAITDICSHHEQVLVVKYSTLQKNVAMLFNCITVRERNPCKTSHICFRVML